MNKNERPFIFCHMETSLDGKIMGKFLWVPETNTDDNAFEAIVYGPDAKYQFQGMVNGRITIEDNFTFYKTPALPNPVPEIPAGDYIAPGASLGMFHFALDSEGRISWEENQTDYGGVPCHVVEVISKKATDSYKAFLREKGISYIICGDEHVDVEEFCRKAKSLFQVQSLFLGGGSVINWSFIQQGLVDEMSLVIAPAADGNPTTQPLFQAKPGFTKDQPVVFKPLEVKIMSDDSVWIRYQVGEVNTYDFDNDPDYKAVQDMIKANA